MARLHSAILAGMGLLVGCAPQRSVTVTVGAVGAATAADCFVEVDGVHLSLGEFETSARRWRGRDVHLDGDLRTPYRCLGAVIYSLQRAGAHRIGFIAEPPAESPTTN